MATMSDDEKTIDEEINLFDWYNSQQDNVQAVLIQTANSTDEAFFGLAGLMLKGKRYDKTQLPILRTFIKSLTSLLPEKTNGQAKEATKTKKSTALSQKGIKGRSQTMASPEEIAELRTSKSVRNTRDTRNRAPKAKEDSTAPAESKKQKGQKKGNNANNNNSNNNNRQHMERPKSVRAGTTRSKSPNTDKRSKSPNAKAEEAFRHERAKNMSSPELLSNATRNDSKSASSSTLLSPKGLHQRNYFDEDAEDDDDNNDDNDNNDNNNDNDNDNDNNNNNEKSRSKPGSTKGKWKPPSWVNVQLVDDSSFLDEKEAYRGDLLWKDAEHQEQSYTGKGKRYSPSPDRSKYGDAAQIQRNPRAEKIRSKSTADLRALAPTDEKPNFAMIGGGGAGSVESWNSSGGGTLAFRRRERHWGGGYWRDDEEKEENATATVNNDNDGTGNEHKDVDKVTKDEPPKEEQKASDDKQQQSQQNGESAKPDDKSWIKHDASTHKDHTRSQSMSAVGKLDLSRFQHLTKISISLTNSQRVVLEDKRDLSLSFRKQKSNESQQSATLPANQTSEKEGS
ncbi:hypothetical protein RFI_11457 [Reticulomyxa filosa]|uniref:Uncharacterized protein n=1 Tax=Reticulomyxa filosa TaxID=46433 RepID=X6NJZ6_RETFI|nr:hypothetical protein RFI_11457 [Reticulomyxa filosa]|eukprot:ETO25682.1 hypothetical protein RFI_11457 [Reticulomyxa filosa]